MSARVFIIILALLAAPWLLGCRGPAQVAKPGSYSIDYLDRHANAFKGLTPGALKTMKVGLIHARYHYVKAMGEMDKARSEAIDERAKTFGARFRGNIAQTLRRASVFALIDSKLTVIPPIALQRTGRGKGGKFLMLELPEPGVPKVAAFVEANSLDAALTVDGSTEYIMFKKKYMMLLRLDWIMYDANGAVLYNVTTYRSAPAQNPVFTAQTAEALSRLARDGTAEFASSLRAVAEGKAAD